MNVVKSFKLAWLGGAVLVASLLFYPFGRFLAQGEELGVAFLFVMVGYYVLPFFAFVGLVLFIVGVVRGRIIENARKIN